MTRTRIRTIAIAAGIPAVAALVTIAAEGAVVSSGIGADSVRMVVVGRAAVLIAVVAAGLVWASRLSVSTKAYAVAAAVGMLLSFVLFVALLGTPLGVNGVTGDAGFRTALVTHSAAFTFPFPDLSYADLPSWYSPLYYWVLGKVSVLIGIEPYKMVKFGALAATFVLPTVVFWVWRWITGDVVRALAAAASLLVVNDTYKVSGWIAVLLFIPWWVVFVDGAGPDLSPRLRIWLGGVCGGLLFLTYPFYFAVGAMALVLGVIVRRWGRWPRKESLRQPLAVLGVSAVVSAPYWLPLLLATAGVDQPVLLMALYFTRPLAEIGFPFLAGMVGGVMMLLGLGWLALRAGTSAVARSLFLLVAGVYASKVVVAVAGALGRPSQVYRFEILTEVSLAIAGAFAVAEMWQWLLRRLAPAGAVVAGVVLLLVAASVGEKYVDGEVEHEWAVRARESAVPIAMLEGFDAATSAERGVTVLSGEFELTVYRPVFLFNTWNAHYAHPASRFHDRNDFIRELSGVSDPARFAEMAAHNEFERIDIAVFRDFGETLVYFYGDHNYPNGPIGRTIEFSRDQFDPAYWRESVSGGFVYLVLIPGT